MNQPSLDELLMKVDCRYTLVSVAAKRARQLTEIRKGKPKASNGEGIVEKDVTEALREIAWGDVSYRRTKQGIK